MNKFDERYFPFKRFSRKHKKFYRFRKWRYDTLSVRGKSLVVQRLNIPAPTPAVTGKKVVFLADWHWHNSPKQQKLLAELTETVKNLHPDVLILGGDMCDDAEYLASLPELLKVLGSLAPDVFAVSGNWEAGKRWLPENYFADLFRQYKITLLENQSVLLDGFRLTGLADISSLNFRQLPEEQPLPGITELLCTHNPDGVVSIARSSFLRNFDLAFCGHTHGGQIRLPLFGALYCPSFYHRKFARGIFGCRGVKMKMIVTSGISEHSHTFRLFCPPEIIFLEFM